ncbi:hypothetical protein NEUTE1DRAFT_80666 [Neurospora tetrasperma FGSC 2508]|uniref:DUF7908 domain-containing protein n=1 Tax=Neurospora tetrasperma (strain FGSC 2508 / ATCC MYA-4615 / P0657) TaxID=510951 RepID=F8MN29_NEUT8|nr:uncharacterized protein NEUTE1DRAFT_80666 [Neurospora tetrasperma FGSC 2508]EGO57202.1 hypothetical protein NEUTE1DRAFT_80666 [Neurospora tetrasperma FGSC 2508]EGZ72554.1 hypothetical protein NEUTE2DRAFT_112225 [Neurospora tetrasperma FGSC 2509]
MRVLAFIPVLAAVASAGCTRRSTQKPAPTGTAQGEGGAWSQCGGPAEGSSSGSAIVKAVPLTTSTFSSSAAPVTTTLKSSSAPTSIRSTTTSSSSSAPVATTVKTSESTVPTSVSSTTLESSTGTPSATTVPSNPNPTVPTSVSSTTLESSTGTPSATTVPSNPNPTVLESGWYWIRAVAAPNFHKYLQGGASSAASSNQTALLEDHTTAGQFNIIDGQLVFNTKPAQLYLNVENPTDKTQRKLKTWFSTTKNAYGTFKFQGDTLTWSVADIKRQNEAAWLVCTGQEVFINTGAYLYQTPAGCSDQTIHSYGGSTADV